MVMKDSQMEPDRNDLKRFGLVTGCLIAGLFGLLFPWLLETAFPYWPWLLAAVLVLWALISPLTLKTIYISWLRFGSFMNRITTPLLLGVVFYLIITPMGLMMRLRGRDMMQLKPDPGKLSYRRQSQYRSRETLERPF
ncbi:MAG: hypothetical protein A2W28_07115 [Gammaproteobacteria bacterium RBG_16_51_14]|nr:MAG: hypothetical protein A2W28_07115 [Gammaproteobacteria bacterium RBG_16_51_14]